MIVLALETASQNRLSARLFPPQLPVRLLPELGRGATLVFGEEAGETIRVGKAERQRIFLDADEGVDEIAFGFEQEPGVDRAERRLAQHLAAHAVEMRRGDAGFAGVEGHGFVRAVAAIDERAACQVTVAILLVTLDVMPKRLLCCPHDRELQRQAHTRVCRRRTCKGVLGFFAPGGDKIGSARSSDHGPGPCGLARKPV